MTSEARPRHILFAAVASVGMLAACGATVVNVDGGTGCSVDNSQSVAVGKFTMVSTQPGMINVLILLANCRWCADAKPDGGSTVLTSEGAWGSTRDRDAGTITVSKTNSLFFNVVSADGRTVRSYMNADGGWSGFEYTRETASAYTCDGS